MVDDYSSDREQEEALRNWWRENWRWIIGGIVLGLALLGGWRYWQDYRVREAEQAFELYQGYQESLSGDAEKASAALKRLIADHGSSAYVQQARLLQAKADSEASRFEAARTQLQAVINESDDDELVHIARLRLARVLIQLGKHEEAVKMLDPETAGAFIAQAREIRGDALFAAGDTDGARAEYAAALAANADARIDRTLLEMKLQQTGGDVSAPASQGQP
jgi:predicted negative regulator of RcsB-dependent stress response